MFGLGDLKTRVLAEFFGDALAGVAVGLTNLIFNSSNDGGDGVGPPLIIPMLLLKNFGVGAKAEARGGSGAAVSGAAVSGDVVEQLHSYCLQFPQYWNDAKGCGVMDVA